MARMNSKFAIVAAGAAALSLAAATPAEARGWGHYHHHDGISFGDVVVGGLNLGGIAAVASAANSSKHKEAYDYPPPPPPPHYDGGYDYAPPPRDRDDNDYAPPRERGYQPGGMNGAVDSCVGQVERGNDRVASVDNATRTADGWHVSGQLAQGAGFDCSVDNDGRIRNVNVGNDHSAYNDAQPQDGQWSDQADAGGVDQDADQGGDDGVAYSAD